MFSLKLIIVVTALIHTFFCLPSSGSASLVEPSSYTLTNLFQNDLSLNYTSSPSFLLVSPSVVGTSISSVCSSFSETAFAYASASAESKSALFYQLKYQASSSGADAFVPGQKFWVAGETQGKCNYIEVGNNGLVEGTETCNENLPLICTQSAPYNLASDVDISKEYLHSIESNGATFTGFRDKLAFAFRGIRYAQNPGRWEYSSVYSPGKGSFNATAFGDVCPQNYATVPISEDCFFLNIWSPVLPSQSSKATNLKPVMVWIHGGAYVSGYSSDPTFTGSYLASRGDVVVVTINYRLGTLGFLSVSSSIPGNYGIGDQITALKWINENIANFGGDPEKVFIFGQSAGAGSVRALLQAQKAGGLFRAAWAESNLDGGDYASTYSNYYSISSSASLYGDPFLQSFNCTSTSLKSVQSCLSEVTWEQILDAAHVASYVVVDGNIIKYSQLPLGVGDSNKVNSVPTMWSFTAEDGAPFIGYPTAGETFEEFLVGSGTLNSTLTEKVVGTQQGKELFVVPNTGNATLDVFNATVQIYTDQGFRCMDQATVVAASKNKIFPAIYLMQTERAYQIPNWDPNAPVCDAPEGDPEKPYMRCHSGDLFWNFGTLSEFELGYRDQNDYLFAQFYMDTIVSFATTLNPNINAAYLELRNYTATLTQVKSYSKWYQPSESSQYPVRRHKYPVENSNYLNQERCQFLGYSLNSYL